MFKKYVIDKTKINSKKIWWSGFKDYFCAFSS
jgi:hypothetical protein